MNRFLTLSIGTTFAIGCASDPQPKQVFDAPSNAGDGAPIPDARVVTLPRWTLEDVQPESPLVGQTYGLDAFNQKIIIVSLLEGF